MSKRIITVVALMGVAGLLAGCDIQQPSAGCIVQDAAFAPWQAKYDLKNAADASKPCNKLRGELLGVWKYADPTKPNSSRLGLRPQRGAALSARSDSPSSATSLGALPDDPDANNFCVATGFNEARVNAKESTTSTGEVLPAVTVAYAFSNVKVYSHPAAPGTQLTGELTYTEDGCSVDYVVNAIWPATHCVPGSTKPADSCGEGSGLNPDFAVVCDEVLEACVAAKPIPSFKN